MSRVTAKTRRLVIERDRHRCVRCSQYVTAPHLQHRRARGMGGSTHPWHNSPANLITLCHRCHLEHVELEREQARRNGWAMPQGILDPATVPVMWHGAWVLLDHDGGVVSGVQLDPSQ